jgi:bifunctional DNase/RNase
VKRSVHARAYEQGNSYEQGKDPSLQEYVQVKVDSVRIAQGVSIVYLRVCDSNSLVIPVHIGEAESNALLKEINKQKQLRPLTHDVAKNIVQALGYRVTKIRVTDIIANTFYARIHLVGLAVRYTHT